MSSKLTQTGNIILMGAKRKNFYYVPVRKLEGKLQFTRPRLKLSDDIKMYRTW